MEMIRAPHGVHYSEDTIEFQALGLVVVLGTSQTVQNEKDFISAYLSPFPTTNVNVARSLLLVALTTLSILCAIVLSAFRQLLFDIK